jgi:hypothetical protein
MRACFTKASDPHARPRDARTLTGTPARTHARTHRHARTLARRDAHACAPPQTHMHARTCACERTRNPCFDNAPPCSALYPQQPCALHCSPRAQVTRRGAPQVRGGGAGAHAGHQHGQGHGAPGGPVQPGLQGRLSRQSPPEPPGRTGPALLRPGQAGQGKACAPLWRWLAAVGLRGPSPQCVLSRGGLMPCGIYKGPSAGRSLDVGVHPGQPP